MYQLIDTNKACENAEFKGRPDLHIQTKIDGIPVPTLNNILTIEVASFVIFT